ncbi:MAG: (d)CMP kinase [Oscillochloris sp.]|nr:(d)CMP kinase [Oscillochloris sp.]
MDQPSVITIDGPAGAGKSTLGALLAARLGYLYFDTGVMYRAFTLAALRADLDLDDEAALAGLAQRISISVRPPDVADGRQYTVLLDTEDVTLAIRSPEVEQHVSRAARFPQVRREMVARQQAIGRDGRVVMVGRDIGTVVMPEAPLKIFLGASIDERARRRLAERAATDLDHVRDALTRRDELDRHVMLPADDALLFNTNDLTPEQEVDWIMAYIQHKERSFHA